MILEGNDWTFFVNGTYVTKDKLINFDLSDMDISVENLSVFYVSPKKEEENIESFGLGSKMKRGKIFTYVLDPKLDLGIAEKNKKSVYSLLQECDEYQKVNGRIDNDKIIYGIDIEKGYFSAPWTFDEKVKDFKFTGDMENGDAKAVGWKPSVSYSKEGDILGNIARELRKEYIEKFGEYEERVPKENKTEGNIYNNIKKDVIYPKSPLECFKGVKETNGKTDYSEIDWNFVEQLAQRMSQNKGKYKKNNWKLPLDVELLKQSLLRHTLAIMKGEYEDDGRLMGHLESVALNAMMINYQLNSAEKE